MQLRRRALPAFYFDRLQLNRARYTAMSIPDEKVPRVPASSQEQQREDSSSDHRAPGRDERGQWLPFFATMFVVYLPVQLLLAHRLGLSVRQTYAVSLGVALLAGFLAQAIFDRLHGSPKAPPFPDRDQAV